MSEPVQTSRVGPVAPASASEPPSPTHALPDPALLSPGERLRLANTLALGTIAESARNLVTHPVKAVAETVRGLGRMLTQPGDMARRVAESYRQDRAEGVIAGGRLATGYIGMAGLAIGGAAILGRLGAGAAGRTALARGLQTLGREAFAVAGRAGTAGIAVDVAALGIHQVQAARATTRKALERAADGLSVDGGSLALNGVTTAAARAGGAGMQALGRHLREQELANSLAQINRTSGRAARLAEGAPAPRAARGSAANADLTAELVDLVGDRVKHLRADGRVELAEYLNNTLSPIERDAAIPAIARKLGQGAGIHDALTAGERATWRQSGVSPAQLNALQNRGWTGRALRDLRRALRETAVAEGQRPATLRALADELPTRAVRTAVNGARMHNQAVRYALGRSLQELGVTRQLGAIGQTDLDFLLHRIGTADLRSQRILVETLNAQGRGTFYSHEYWTAAYERLYADLGIDAAIPRALSERTQTGNQSSALERVYDQLKALPDSTRAQVSRAVAAMEITPANAPGIVRRVQTTALAESIRSVLPDGEKANAARIANQLTRELADTHITSVRTDLARGIRRMPAELLGGDLAAIQRFARGVARSKAQGEAVMAATTSGVARLPEGIRRQVFAGLHADQPLVPQVASRLSRAIEQDFQVQVQQGAPERVVELVGLPESPANTYSMRPMDAPGAIHLYNALQRMSGPNGALPEGLSGARFARWASPGYSGMAIRAAENEQRIALLGDQALVDTHWSTAAGTANAEGVWIHESGHHMQATSWTAPERRMIREWARLGEWRHGDGSIPDGRNPLRSDSAAYVDPAVGGNTREVVSNYGRTDPIEDWAEFAMSATSDPVNTLRHAPHKFLYFASRMPPDWASPHLARWATEAGVDLAAARGVVSQRMGSNHPTLARIDELLGVSGRSGRSR